ncbi:MAG: class I SAM-dependent RNA methyltransferase, partial [Alphaproteobacteria bacterium]|nr:class I SAM-dependent RNA methyltransferase [Alphaproteobacteria bacterium]
MSQLTIKRLGHQGDGIAEGDIFVPFALPGEVVEGEIISGRMDNPRILTPSDQRVKAPCAHFKTCGGCVMQHATDSLVADWKSQIVSHALGANGLSAPLLDIATSPARSRRRATLTGRRTKKGAMVGFHGRASGTIVAIPACTLLHPDILAAVPVFEILTRLGASRSAPVAIAVTCSEAGLDVSVCEAKPADGPLLIELGSICERHKLARLSWNDQVIAMRAAPVQAFGPAHVTPPPAAFLQATRAGQDALTDAVLGIITPASRIVDLFAGCGTFSLPAAQIAEVHAVEGEAGPLDALLAGAKNTTGLKPVTTETRDLFRRPLLTAELNKFDAAIIDPPRAGAKAQTAELAQSSIGKIAFVSCNPATFARDAATLVEGGFTIDWVKPVDQFRWSAHVELVASFSR